MLPSKQEFVELNPSALEWLYQSHRSLVRARTAVAVPDSIFAELVKADYMYGFATKAQITQEGYLALGHFRNMDEARQKKMR